MKRAILFLLFFLISNSARAQYQVNVGDASFVIPVQAISSSDGTTEKTDISSLTCYKTINGATPVACSGASSEVEVGDTPLMPGLWKYTLAAGDTASAGSVVFRFSATGMVPFRKEVQVGGTVGLIANAVNTTTLQDGSLTSIKLGQDGTVTSTSNTQLNLSGGITTDNQFNNGWRIVVFNSSNPSVASSCIVDSEDAGTDYVITQDNISALITTSPADKFKFIPDSLCGPKSELAALPSATPSLADMVQFVYQYSRNKIITTNDSTTLYKNDDTTALGASTVGDNGTQFTRGRMQ